MANAPRTKPVELVSHLDFTTAHAARVASIHSVKATELAELEAATTRAHNAHTRALKVAVTEHAAERLARHEAVVSESIAGLRSLWESYIIDHGISRAETLGKAFRHRDRTTLRDLGRHLENELAVALCEHFAAKHPSANALARFASLDNWARAGDSGIGFFANRANEALRNQYDIKSIQDSLLALESVIARVATSPGYVNAEPELWPIIAGCWPGDIAEQKRQAHTAAVKARNIAAHVEETSLRVAAARGDAAARAKIAERGPGFLEAVLKNAKSIVRMVGLHEREAAPL